MVNITYTLALKVLPSHYNYDLLLLKQISSHVHLGSKLFYHSPRSQHSFLAHYFSLLQISQSTQQKASKSLCVIKYTLVTSIQTTKGNEVAQASPRSPSADNSYILLTKTQIWPAEA